MEQLPWEGGREKVSGNELRVRGVLYHFPVVEGSEAAESSSCAVAC